MRLNCTCSELCDLSLNDGVGSTAVGGGRKQEAFLEDVWFVDSTYELSVDFDTRCKGGECCARCKRDQDEQPH